MPTPALTKRVEILEEKVGALADLPARVTAVEAQIVQLRVEVHDEFAALRREIGTLSTREETAILASTLRDDLRAVDLALRAEIRAGDEETRRYMRVLHEDLVGRIALLQEPRKTNRKRR